jgi:hypothetical protein
MAEQFTTMLQLLRSKPSVIAHCSGSLRDPTPLSEVQHIKRANSNYNKALDGGAIHDYVDYKTVIGR